MFGKRRRDGGQDEFGQYDEFTKRGPYFSDEYEDGYDPGEYEDGFGPEEYTGVYVPEKSAESRAPDEYPDGYVRDEYRDGSVPEEYADGYAPGEIWDGASYDPETDEGETEKVYPRSIFRPATRKPNFIVSVLVIVHVAFNSGNRADKRKLR